MADYIDPWEQERPGVPENGNVRLNMLTPSGLHFGYGGCKTLYEEPIGNAILSPATRLLQGLTAKGK